MSDSTDLADARATLEGALIDGLATSADKTGLRAGPAMDIVVRDQLKALLSPCFRWALRVLGKEEHPRR